MMKKNTSTARGAAKRKAFSLAEVLIALIITAILGVIIVTAMDVFMSSYLQMDDYTVADLELEQAFMRLTREFALIGLGMPNNRQAQGSFALSFRDALDGQRPIMAYFGEPSSSWGGPVTVSSGDAASPAIPRPTTPRIQDGVHIGSDLYYAWAVPTGVKTMVDAIGGADTDFQNAKNGSRLRLSFNPPTHAEVLKNFIWDGQEIGIPETGFTGRNMRTWLALPTLRLPLRAEMWVGNDLEVTAAPVPDSDLGTMTMSRTIMSLDEVHLMQAARLCLRGEHLVRQVAGEDYTSNEGKNREDILANSVVALCFAYDPEERLLSMFIALRGRERPRTGLGTGIDYPSWLPDDARVSAEDSRFHIVAKTLTWRIRN